MTMRNSTDATPKQAAQAAKTAETPRLRGLLDPTEIAEQRAYQRRMLAAALGDQAPLVLRKKR